MTRFPRKALVRLGRLWILLVFGVTAHVGFSAQPKNCVPPEAAAKLVHKDVCVEVHVFDVIEQADGTRFLDVCGPETRDEECRFTILSLREDRADVGELQKFRDADVHVVELCRVWMGAVAWC